MSLNVKLRSNPQLLMFELHACAMQSIPGPFCAWVQGYTEVVCVCGYVRTQLTSVLTAQYGRSTVWRIHIMAVFDLAASQP